MRVKLILPALVEACRPGYRAIKYALFPPLGLATLAAYLNPDDEVTITDEHVERLDLNDSPDLVGIQVYVTNARRAYQIARAYRARGVHVVVGGLHVTSLPEEAARHAGTVILGPAEASWPRFLADWRAGRPLSRYESAERTLVGAPPPRRDLINRRFYLAPNSLVVSRGCPHHCDFCYKDAFFRGGRSHYTRRVDAALAEIASLPGRHLYFLDDHLFADRRFAAALFDGMRGMGRLWQAAGTVGSILESKSHPRLMEQAAECGLRSLFVGFETINAPNLEAQRKDPNVRRDYAAAVRRLRDLGIMVNASFVFGMDHDGPDVFGRTVDWAVRQGVETATFHILTPYPGTRLYARLAAQGRLLDRPWDCYDTRHAVFRPARMTPAELEQGYWQAYRDFYRWGAMLRGAWTKPAPLGRLRHLAYAAGWKKLEPLWDLVLRSKRVSSMLPLLEAVLSAGGRVEPEMKRRGAGFTAPAGAGAATGR